MSDKIDVFVDDRFAQILQAYEISEILHVQISSIFNGNDKKVIKCALPKSEIIVIKFMTAFKIHF